jgi:hypothetical protein
VNRNTQLAVGRWRPSGPPLPTARFMDGAGMLNPFQPAHRSQRAKKFCPAYFLLLYRTDTKTAFFGIKKCSCTQWLYVAIWQQPAVTGQNG